MRLKRYCFLRSSQALASVKIAARNSRSRTSNSASIIISIKSFSQSAAL